MAKGGDEQPELPFVSGRDPAPSKPRKARKTNKRRRPSGQPSAAPSPSAAPQPAPSPSAASTPAEPESPDVLSVARLDRLIKQLLEGATADLLVRGEVSGLRRAASGHVYFSLKDEREDAVIDCVMYRSAPQRARKQLRDGENVVLAGRVTIYAPRGRMQLIAADVLQTARGALLAALEQLKAKLADEGLFAAERKRPLPRDPRRIAVLTSSAGAAIHDFVRVAFRRGSGHILLVPTPVQGAGAAGRISLAIELADGLGVDAIVVTRGGGSAEDLAAYNDELVVRAIAAARTPVVSAVGHEVDVSLADLAADARAATPSAAAELLVADASERRATLGHLRQRLETSMRHHLVDSRQRLGQLQRQLGHPSRMVHEQAQRFDELGRSLERAMHRHMTARRTLLEQARRQLDGQHPRTRLHDARLRLSTLQPRLQAATRRAVDRREKRLRGLTAQLDAMSPLAVLSRGYAIATRDGHVLTDADSVRPGDNVDVRLHRGVLKTTVADDS